MRERRRAWVAALAAALVTVAAGTAGAQTPEPRLPPGAYVESYVVQAGDTLIGLTQRELGDADLWMLNWTLNPEVRDPHHLQPGQHIRIYRRPRTGEPQAEIRALAEHVDKKPHPDPSWTSAHLGDQLKDKDGVRTYERSSAELGFDDGSRLTVTEQSLVFLRRVGATLAGGPPRSLELVDGQADLETRPPAAGGDGPAVEIVMGAARTSTRPSAGAAAQARARHGQGGAAQLMVYAGESDVEASGRSVRVARGQGTSVPKGGTPATPELLLPAPLPSLPLSAASFDHSNPRFSWDVVRGAFGYVVEVCRDPACGELVARATRLKGTRWTPDSLPMGMLYWRVTAVSRSGLDGYPSAPQSFTIRALWRRPATDG
jgi:hypothetical protein